MLAVRQHDAGDSHLVEGADRLADHSVGVVADLAVGDKIIGTHEVEVINFAAGHELIDLDGAGGFERDVFQLVLGHLKILVCIDLVALDDVLTGDFLARIGIDLEVAYPVAGFPVDLVETDFLGFRSRREQGDRAGHERKPQKALPIGARGHTQTPPI
jgi:hypothetical protein